MLGAFMTIWSFAILPIVFRVRFSLGNDFLPVGAIGIKTIGFALQLDWKTLKSNDGISVVLRYGGKKRLHEHKVKELKQMQPQMGLLLHDAPALKKNLFSYFKNLRIKSDISIGLSDAAATALACGAASALLGCFERIEAQIRPDFNSEGICVNARCIVACPMGKLLLSAALYLHASIMQRTRQKAGGNMHGKSASD